VSKINHKTESVKSIQWMGWAICREWTCGTGECRSGGMMDDENGDNSVSGKKLNQTW